MNAVLLMDDSMARAFSLTWLFGGQACMIQWAIFTLTVHILLSDESSVMMLSGIAFCLQVHR